MSLDVTLRFKGEVVYDANITHNLGLMASSCGVYHACWRPREIHCKKAKHILPMLEDGIGVLIASPAHYKTFDAANEWGTYHVFLNWLEEYAAACRAYPEAKISVSR